jgi:hypothetical protein
MIRGYHLRRKVVRLNKDRSGRVQCDQHRSLSGPPVGSEERRQRWQSARLMWRSRIQWVERDEGVDVRDVRWLWVVWVRVDRSTVESGESECQGREERSVERRECGRLRRSQQGTNYSTYVLWIVNKDSECRPLL